MVMSFTDHKNGFNNSQREMMPSYFIFYDIVSKKNMSCFGLICMMVLVNNNKRHNSIPCLIPGIQ